MPRGKRSSISIPLRIEVAEKCNCQCQICGETGDLDRPRGVVLSRQEEPIDFDCNYYKRISMEIDHIVPLEKGGKTELDNLQILCRFCNRSKAIKSIKELKKLSGLSI